MSDGELKAGDLVKPNIEVWQQHARRLHPSLTYTHDLQLVVHSSLGMILDIADMEYEYSGKRKMCRVFWFKHNKIESFFANFLKKVSRQSSQNTLQ